MYGDREHFPGLPDTENDSGSQSSHGSRSDSRSEDQSLKLGNQCDSDFMVLLAKGMVCMDDVALHPPPGVKLAQPTTPRESESEKEKEKEREKTKTKQKRSAKSQGRRASTIAAPLNSLIARSHKDRDRDRDTDAVIPYSTTATAGRGKVGSPTSDKEEEITNYNSTKRTRACTTSSAVFPSSTSTSTTPVSRKKTTLFGTIRGKGATLMMSQPSPTGRKEEEGEEESMEELLPLVRRFKNSRVSLIRLAE